MATVYWAVGAREDLFRIGQHIAAESSPRRARLFVDRLRTSAESLRLFPQRGRHVPEIDDPEMREMIVGRYRILYRYRDGVVSIAAIIHGARADWAKDWR